MAIERIVPGTKEWDEYYANHICRYVFAQQCIEQWGGQNILDAACGVGYGSSFLANNENLTVTAIDRSLEALKIANEQFASTNIKFLDDDCHTLASAATLGPFDTIVSFETLEHLPQPELFLKNCFSNLKSGGKLIVSTPNQLVSSPDGNLNWEYHEKEYTPEELVELLSAAGFADIKLHGQQMTSMGIFRNQIRAELNRLNSNPFMRLGRKIQELLKSHKFPAMLPEQADDFEIKLYDSGEEILKQGVNGPFVLIATCDKP